MHGEQSYRRTAVTVSFAATAPPRCSPGVRRRPARRRVRRSRVARYPRRRAQHRTRPPSTGPAISRSRGPARSVPVQYSASIAANGQIFVHSPAAAREQRPMQSCILYSFETDTGRKRFCSVLGPSAVSSTPIVDTVANVYVGDDGGMIRSTSTVNCVGAHSCTAFLGHHSSFRTGTSSRHPVGPDQRAVDADGAGRSVHSRSDSAAVVLDAPNPRCDLPTTGSEHAWSEVRVRRGRYPAVDLGSSRSTSCCGVKARSHRNWLRCMTIRRRPPSRPRVVGTVVHRAWSSDLLPPASRPVRVVAGRLDGLRAPTPTEPCVRTRRTAALQVVVLRRPPRERRARGLRRRTGLSCRW